ncbi:MAG: cysteine hydrolase [Candidatus Methanomethyliaceae archaeon]|nr:cysteine hydrolase [Candidatus Methanomethyliaceae archaeon]MDW7970522.1 isochorismatase family cysteine hydrolase [Nitrososphaerota archaeon]
MTHMHPSILVIDMLKDFIYGKFERVRRIIPNIQRLLNIARRIGIPIIYCNDAHYEIDFEVVNRWGLHAIKGTEGAEVISELKPEERDFIVEKHTYSAFHETELDTLLRGLKVDTVILTGVLTNICIQHTAADAFFRGYGIIVVRDCVEALTEEDQEKGLKYLEFAYNAKIMSLNELIAELEKSS